MLEVAYPLHRHDLANGMQVVINPDPTSAGVAINLWYRVGSSDEAPERTGFAHLFEHLMFAGTTSGVAAGEHLAAVQAAGGHANATTSFDRTNYFETVQSGAVEFALWLEAERLVRLQLDQQALDTQREVVAEERRQRYDNVPYGDALELLMRLNFDTPGPTPHPYAHPPIGDMAQLRHSSLDEVAAFHAQWYRASNAILVLAGGISVDHGITLAERYFGELGSPPRPIRREVPRLGPHRQPVTEVARRDVPADTLHLGWRVPPDDDRDALILAQALAIAGDGQASWLHQSLVRSTEQVEGVGASTLGLTRADDVALISTRVRSHADTAAVRESILEQVGRLGTQGPSELELERVVAQHERELLGTLASVESRADAINAYTLTRDDPERINTEMAELRTITVEDVTRVSREWLDPNRVATLQYERTTR